MDYSLKSLRFAYGPEAVEVIVLLRAVFNTLETSLWLRTRNAAFENDPPAYLIVNGYARRVLTHVKKMVVAAGREDLTNDN